MDVEEEDKPQRKKERDAEDEEKLRVKQRQEHAAKMLAQRSLALQKNLPRPYVIPESI